MRPSRAARTASSTHSPGGLSRRLDAQGDAGRLHSWGSRKNRLSIARYALAIGLSLVYAPLGAVIHVLLALLWLMPEACRPPRTEQP